MAVVNAIRIRRFAIAVRECDMAPLPIRTMAIELSGRLGLWRVPDVLMTSRNLPPLVWSIGLFPRVILPSQLFARLGSEAQAAILAHELCHIRRGDYLVRFLEVAATTIFWWHPGVWCARWQLRELEEQCCDGRVLALLEHQPRSYAAALVDTLEFLSERPRTPAPFHTAVYSSGSLSRRIRMLSQNRTNRLTALSAALVAGLVTLPLVVAFAVDIEQTSKTAPAGKPSAGAPPAVLRGRVTDEAGAPLADVRVRVAIRRVNKRVVGTPFKPLESKSDSNGNYRLEIPGITERTRISIDAMKPGYSRLIGIGMKISSKFVDVMPGNVAEASLTLESALYFAGSVVDEQGKPIPAVKIQAIAGWSALRTSVEVENTVTKSDGSFELFNYPVKPRVIRDQVSKGVVFFVHPDYVGHEIPEAYALAPKERESLRIVLGSGHKVTGTVLDVAGKPVANAIVKAIGNDWTRRKATATDANGKFALRGISKGPTKFSATAMDIRQIIHLSMDVKSDQMDLQIRLKTISWPTDLKKYAVLGMQLSDVTPELRSTYGFSSERGVLILDPGKDSDRLKLRWLAEGSVFFSVGVGRKRIGSVREFVDQILSETAGQAGDAFSVHVGYNFHTVAIDGGTSGELKLTKDELKELRIVADQLAKDSQ